MWIKLIKTKNLKRLGTMIMILVALDQLKDDCFEIQVDSSGSIVGTLIKLATTPLTDDIYEDATNKSIWYPHKVVLEGVVE
ncbi:hypothetical protein PV327_002041 [Microctonus hyperodae]|uniref:Uncharacterized protein n=1 Tax=Microctonus hyperodae TaxID=165561 RepID=A0AA39FEX8_MICHY|nr:hypothetical protein PV327_002041 [Microctonus hyperodae]